VIFAVAEDCVPGTGKCRQRAEIGSKTGGKDSDRVDFFPGRELLFEVLLIGRASDDQRTGTGACLEAGDTLKGSQDVRVKAEAEVVV
jgi:hypothetical protein